jgi:GDP-4-dehydro-6-deoxy-D-mannose reductase
MKILITGITGFVGSHLAEFLLKKGDCEIYGLKRWRSPLTNIKAIAKDITLIDGDLRDSASMNKIIRDIQPDRIFHLAAQSYVPTSFNAPTDTIETNVNGTINLLEAVRNAKINPRIHICSSSEVYGQVYENELPIKEINPFRPSSPYAISKVGEDLVGAQYFKSFGMQNIISRSFTHTGPRRGEVFVVSAFAKQIAEIEKGKREPVLRHGNLKSVRTFLDVRDIVRAYDLLIEKGEPGEAYNIGGETHMEIGEMLNMLLKMSDTKIELVVDPKLLRPSDVTLQIPDVSKFKEATGWKPEIPFEQTLKDTLDYWRARV